MPLSWNTAGLLPPVAPNEHPAGLDRSPYRVTMAEAVDLFVTTELRLDLFRGFIRYRKALYSAGVRSGFQWLNGSFVEQVERIRKKPPMDVDVVTFVYLPQDCSNQRDLYVKSPDLFSSAKTKANFQVDGYMIFLGDAMTDKSVQKVSYWYSLWSHQRETGAWKGFVQLDLTPDADDFIEDILKMKKEELCYESGGAVL